ncbi:MAG: SpoIIE family protein phosphatase [Thermoanaerobaculia bacterium]|nr:SpoIIE family protein phosphatase [Thermoanaerobaculia bacterium]MBP9823670.1 SpoIIE family protein phosphatase [Thermoanaerobaculia bacterium]
MNPKRPTRILLAEDQRLQARMILAVIEALGLEPVLAGDGETAWRILSSDDPPPVALLDWMMPELSGVEVCRRLLDHPRRSSIYLILLTARDTTEDIVAGLEAGANDFVTKPFEPRELLARIQVGLRVVALERELADRMGELERALEERAAAEKRLREARAREVEVADRIQQTLLLGAPPEFPGLETAALSAASEGVDGDFYDFISHGDDLLDVVVGDVMGKGLPAALVAAAIKAEILRVLARRGSTSSETAALPSPAALLDAVARALAPRLSDLERFATLVLARFDLGAGRLTLVDAGHTATILVRAAATEPEELPGLDPPLGISDDPRFREVSTTIANGDLVVFYSDGLTEARNPQGELFGVARLRTLVGEERAASPRRIVDAMHAAVRTFVGSAPISDDLTCVAVRIHGRARSGSHATALDLTANLDELPRLRAMITSAAAGPPASLDETRLRALVLAVNEAFVNIVRHAVPGRTDARIRLETIVDSERVEVSLVHDGIAFDPATAPTPDFEGGRASGFGVYLIASSVDEVRYENDPGSRRVRLTTFVRRAAPISETEGGDG